LDKPVKVAIQARIPGEVFLNSLDFRRKENLAGFVSDDLPDAG
jgi:hypothetical protein